MSDETTITTEYDVHGITLKLITEGKELQAGHEIGCDGLHLEVQQAVEEVLVGYE